MKYHWKESKTIGKLTKTIKGKRAIFETFLKSRLSYAAQEISYIFSHYKNKWSSMIYRVLKAILNINQNIKKKISWKSCQSVEIMIRIINFYWSTYSRCFELKLRCLLKNIQKQNYEIESKLKTTTIG